MRSKFYASEYAQKSFTQFDNNTYELEDFDYRVCRSYYWTNGLNKCNQFTNRGVLPNYFSRTYYTHLLDTRTIRNLRCVVYASFLTNDVYLCLLEGNLTIPVALIDGKAGVEIYYTNFVPAEPPAAVFELPNFCKRQSLMNNDVDNANHNNVMKKYNRNA